MYIYNSSKGFELFIFIFRFYVLLLGYERVILLIATISFKFIFFYY